MIATISRDVERETRAAEFGELKLEVANIKFIVSFDVTLTLIGHLKLSLNY